MTHSFLLHLEELQAERYVRKHIALGNTYLHIKSSKELLELLLKTTYSFLGKKTKNDFSIEVYKTNIGEGYRPYLSIGEVHNLSAPLHIKNKYANIHSSVHYKNLPANTVTSRDTYLFVNDNIPFYLVIGVPLAPNTCYFNFNIDPIICSTKDIAQYSYIRRIEIDYLEGEE